MSVFFDGAIMTTYAAIAVFFWQFWKKSRDRFYVMFALAFWILGANRLLHVLMPVVDEGVPLYYFIRFLAFLVILIAIADKNYSR